MPLIRKGLVHSVWPRARPPTQPGDPVLLTETIAVDVVLEEGTDPETYRDEIEGLIKQAGITGVTIILRRRPSL
jgi:hypothetical protein